MKGTVIPVAVGLGLRERELHPYGRFMAKVSLEALERIPRRAEGKYIFITALTPTPGGEGKTVTAIALSMALNRMGRDSVATLRQPSAGLYFARKGGGSGGGRARLVPQEEIDFHCTGDTHAVGLAHNLAAAHIDNRYYWSNEASPAKGSVFWKRAVDLCDRALRTILIGAGREYTLRSSGFIMAQASELMSILSLSRSHREMQRRISGITLGLDKNDNPVRMRDVVKGNELSEILRQALLPNLVLTAESTPAVLHCGPFSNISHGNCSVLADELGMRIADYVITEGGGGADTGFEKFLAIKHPVLRRLPDAVVLVATARALRMHGLATLNRGVIPGENELSRRNDAALRSGLRNLERHIRVVKAFGFPLVVAVNRFSFDSSEEIRLIEKAAREAGADFAAAHEGWQKGGRGAIGLARAVMEAAGLPFRFRKLYGRSEPFEERLARTATLIYGAAAVEITPGASGILRKVERHMPPESGLCIAKTHLSLSHDSRLKNVPERYTLPVTGFVPFTGAGYLCALTKDLDLMPGMPPESAGNRRTGERRAR